MLRKVSIAVLVLCAMALAQPPQGGSGMPPGGPGSKFGPGAPGGPHGGEMHPLMPPGRWWKDAGLAKTIGLSEGQVQKIEQVFQEHRVKLVDVHSALQKEEFKLEPLLESDNPDEGAVLAAIDRITIARAAVEKANAQMAFAIRRVLTPEQWKKLRSLHPAGDHFAPPMCPPPGFAGPQHGAPQHHGHPQAPPAMPEPPADEKGDPPASK